MSEDYNRKEEWEKETKNSEPNFTLSGQSYEGSSSDGDCKQQEKSPAAPVSSPYGQKENYQNNQYQNQGGGYQNAGQGHPYGSYGPGYGGQNSQQRYQSYQFQQEQGKEPQGPPLKAKKVKKKREKKPGTGLGQKMKIVVPVAVVFGLVAGVVFQGVNLVGNRLLGTNEAPAAQSSQLSSTPLVQGESNATKTSTSTGGGTVADVAASAMPSVVAITAVSVQQIPDFFGYGTQEYKGVGSGSGIIVGENDTELLIATNNHVVDGASDLSVSFIGEEVVSPEETSEKVNGEETGITPTAAEDDVDTDNSVSANVKGTDSDKDLAVIAVKKSDIPADVMSRIKIATLGESEDLVVGEQVVAIGNALGYGQSVTSGYISALNHSVTIENTTNQFIQTDAAINPGNSGGALLNMSGQLIGINSAKIASDTVEGMGYAIPISDAKETLDKLMSQKTKEKVTEGETAYLGVVGMEVDDQSKESYGIPSGAFLTDVLDGQAAQKAGLKKGDVITTIDGQKISTYSELKDELQYYAAGDKAEITYKRAESGEYKEYTTEVTFGAKSE